MDKVEQRGSLPASMMAQRGDIGHGLTGVNSTCFTSKTTNHRGKKSWPSVNKVGKNLEATGAGRDRSRNFRAFHVTTSIEGNRRSIFF